MNKPFVTVMTPYYNDQKFLADAISSVLAQTYSNFEYILVNHASTDKSREIAHSFSDPRIKHIDLPFNYGASGNILIKKALEIAQGTYLKIICADDMLHPDGLEKLLKKAQKEQADLVFGNVSFINKKKEPMRRNWFQHRHPIPNNIEECIASFIGGVSRFPYAGNFIRIEALQDLSMDYVCVQLADMGLWISMILQGKKVSFMQEAVADYRIHTEQMCSVSKIDIIEKRNSFEQILYSGHYFTDKADINLLKKAFPEDAFISKITDEDRELIPFAMAQLIRRVSPNYVYRLSAWIQTAHMLNNYKLQKKIELKFGYTIKDLREDIVKNPIAVFDYNSQPLKKASLKQLSYYFFRKIFHILLLKEWKEKRKREKILHNEDGVV